ncbi:17685_t:CDS:2, partial [Racocetra persica]
MNDKGKCKATKYLETDENLRIFCKLCKAAKFDNAFTQETNIFKKDIVKRHDEKDLKHQKAKEHLVVNSDNISSDPQILKFSALSLEESSEYKGYETYLNHVTAQNFAIAIIHIIEEKLIDEIKSAKNW